MMIYEQPMCAICKIERALCIYAETQICGRCLEKVIKKESEKKKKLLLEIQE